MKEEVLTILVNPHYEARPRRWWWLEWEQPVIRGSGGPGEATKECVFLRIQKRRRRNVLFRCPVEGEGRRLLEGHSGARGGRGCRHVRTEVLVKDIRHLLDGRVRPRRAGVPLFHHFRRIKGRRCLGYQKSRSTQALRRRQEDSASSAIQVDDRGGGASRRWFRLFVVHAVIHRFRYFAPSAIPVLARKS